MAIRRQSISISLFALLVSASAARADVKPAPFFSDHVVLQTGMPVPIWGTAAAGEKVSVTLNGQTQTATTGADGKWMVRLTDLKAGGPYEMTIAGTNKIAVKDVLVGEVWLGSGQSNMQFTVSKKKAGYAGLINEEQEIAAANYPKLRMFMGKPATAFDPQPVTEGEWQVCSPETVPAWSAVGYLFGRNLQKELDVPVGMLVLAFGASTAEAWIPREAMAADPLLKPMLDNFDALAQVFKANPSAASGPGAQTPADHQCPSGPAGAGGRAGPGA